VPQWILVQPSSNISPLFCSLIPTQNNMGLTAMKNLNLTGQTFFKDELGSTFLEHLLPCCPNLRTFILCYYYDDLGGKPLDPNWWPCLLASNNILKRISISLCGSANKDGLNDEVIQGFQSSTYFAKLKAKFKPYVEKEFLRFIRYSYYIEN
jgi:hypothetical protein